MQLSLCKLHHTHIQSEDVLNSINTFFFHNRLSVFDVLKEKKKTGFFLHNYL